MKAKEVLLQGYNIDRTCYPNISYKGARLNPTDVRFILTELEEKLLEALQIAQEAIGWEIEPSEALRDAYYIVKEAIVKAGCRF